MKTMVKTAMPTACCENCYWCGSGYRVNKREHYLVCMKDDLFDDVYPVVYNCYCCEDWLDRDNKVDMLEISRRKIS